MSVLELIQLLGTCPATAAVYGFDGDSGELQPISGAVVCESGIVELQTDNIAD